MLLLYFVLICGLEQNSFLQSSFLFHCFGFTSNYPKQAVKNIFIQEKVILFGMCSPAFEQPGPDYKKLTWFELIIPAKNQ